MKLIRRLLARPSLNDILEFAIKKGACHGNLNAFKKAIEKGDEKLAWQIVKGNIGWLKHKGLRIQLKYVNKKSGYIGRIYDDIYCYTIYFFDQNDNVTKLQKYSNGSLIREIYNSI